MLQVEDTFKKVGYDPTANAQTRRVGTASGDQEGEGAPAGGGGGGLPRMDLSTLLEKVLNNGTSFSLIGISCSRRCS